MAKVCLPSATKEERKHLISLSDIGDFDKVTNYGDFEITIKINSPTELLESPPQYNPENGEEYDKDLAKLVQDTVNSLASWTLEDEHGEKLPVNFDSVMLLNEKFKPTFTEILQAIESTKHGLTKETWKIMKAKERELYLKNSKD